MEHVHVISPVNMLFASDEVIVFSLLLFLSPREIPLYVHMSIYGTFPTLRPNKVFIHMFLLEEFIVKLAFV